MTGPRFNLTYAVTGGTSGELQPPPKEEEYPTRSTYHMGNRSIFMKQAVGERARSKSQES